jgi:hypothetical protein
MRTPISLAGLIVPALLSACAGTADSPGRELVTVQLQPASEVAGEIGRAFLMPQGEGTRVQIEVTGVPQLTTRPVHLYTFVYEGPCGKLAAQPAYVLFDRVLAQSSGTGVVSLGGPPFTVSNTAPVPLQKLRAGNFAIVVKTSPADGDREIYCGDVK